MYEMRSQSPGKAFDNTVKRAWGKYDMQPDICTAYGPRAQRSLLKLAQKKK